MMKLPTMRWVIDLLSSIFRSILYLQVFVLGFTLSEYTHRTDHRRQQVYPHRRPMDNPPTVIVERETHRTPTRAANTISYYVLYCKAFGQSMAGIDCIDVE